MINAIHRYMVVAFRVFALGTFAFGSFLTGDALYGWSYDWTVASLEYFAGELAGGLAFFLLTVFCWRVSEFERRFVK